MSPDIALGPEARVAIYYAPAADDPLWTQGCAWLGRNAETGEPAAQPNLCGLAAVTAAPALYGFHATLKPPFHLRPGATWSDVMATAATAARTLAPIPLPQLRVAALNVFLALIPTAPAPQLDALAAAMVKGFDHLRAPPSSAELARRRAHGLTPAQETLLQRWGYPAVLDQWRFHITLTSRLTAAQRAYYAEAAVHHFAAACAKPRHITDICLFVQPADAAPFHLATRIILRG